MFVVHGSKAGSGGFVIPVEFTAIFDQQVRAWLRDCVVDQVCVCGLQVTWCGVVHVKESVCGFDVVNAGEEFWNAFAWISGECSGDGLGSSLAAWIVEFGVGEV